SADERLIVSLIHTEQFPFPLKPSSSVQLRSNNVPTVSIEGKSFKTIRFLSIRDQCGTSCRCSCKMTSLLFLSSNRTEQCIIIRFRCSQMTLHSDQFDRVALIFESVNGSI